MSDNPTQKIDLSKLTEEQIKDLEQALINLVSAATPPTPRLRRSGGDGHSSHVAFA